MAKTKEKSVPEFQPTVEFTLAEPSEEWAGKDISEWPKEELERLILESGNVRTRVVDGIRESILVLQAELDRRFRAEHPRQAR